MHKIYLLNDNFKRYFNNYDFHNLYKELLNFCTVDLSAFYFDIRKDALYCDSKDSERRKSCIIVLNILLESLSKWFAPILSFTTEEIFKLINKDEKSIHLEKFMDFPKSFENNQLNNKWIELKKIRDQKNIDFDIEIDGGINFDNNKLAIEAGANILVSGTTIFKNNNGDIKKNIDLLKSS